MRTKRRFKITVVDEAHIETLWCRVFSPRQLAGWGAVIFAGILAIGFLFVLLTPAKQLIPGYFRPSQRAVAEKALLRLDSLSQLNSQNEAYLKNITEVFSIERIPSATAEISEADLPFSPDSLPDPSAEEIRFLKKMREREKYNVALTSLMAAEGMLFTSPTDVGVLNRNSSDNYRPAFVTPPGSAVRAIAEGAVLGVFHSADDGFSVIVQHDNGFVSKISGLGRPLVADTDIVGGGEVLGFSSENALKPSPVRLSLWHHGTPVKPLQYLPESYGSAANDSPTEDLKTR